MFYLIRLTLKWILDCFAGIGDKRFGAGQKFAKMFRAECRRLWAAKRVVWITGADYASGDLAQARVKDAILAHAPNAETTYFSVGNFDTKQLGFYALVSMMAPLEHLPRWVVGFFNAAPIPAGSEKRNGGHAFYALLLTNGKIVFSPNADFSLSFFLPYTVAIAEIDAHEGTKQFRSWQCYPKAAAQFLRGDFRDVKRIFAPTGNHGIPAVSEDDVISVAGIDNFGNLETTFTVADAERRFASGDAVQFSFDGQKWFDAVYGAGPGVNGERFTIAPSSKIIEIHPGAFVQFHDVFIVGGNAATELDCIVHGAELILRHRPESRVNSPQEGEMRLHHDGVGDPRVSH